MTYNAKDLCESLHCTYIYTSPIEKIPKISSSLRKCIKKRFRKKKLQGTSHLYRKLPVTVVNIAQLRLSCWRLHLEKVSVVARLIWLSLCDIYTYSMFTCYCLFFDKMFTGLCTLYSLVSYPWFSTSTPSNLSPGFFFWRGMFF